VDASSCTFQFNRVGQFSLIVLWACQGIPTRPGESLPRSRLHAASGAGTPDAAAHRPSPRLETGTDRDQGCLQSQSGYAPLLGRLPAAAPRARRRWAPVDAWVEVTEILGLLQCKYAVLLNFS
jgi:hypothetical protein